MKLTRSKLREIIKEEMSKINVKKESKSTRLTDIMEDDITEGLALIRKIVKRAKKLGIDNWDDLEDLIRDEFPSATGADFTFARQELGI